MKSVGYFTLSTGRRRALTKNFKRRRRSMINSGSGLITYFIVLSLLVAADIVDGLLGEQFG
jgi:hypothetical protein